MAKPPDAATVRIEAIKVNLLEGGATCGWRFIAITPRSARAPWSPTRRSPGANAVPSTSAS